MTVLLFQDYGYGDCGWGWGMVVVLVDCSRTCGDDPYAKLGD
jgi:hypothetical protein